MKFHITIENGKCDLSAFLSHIAGLRGDYVISVERDGKTRTNPQNRWLWGCIYPMLLDGLNAAGWEFTNTDEVHDFCGRFRDREVVNRHSGEVVHVSRSTREMGTVEMSTYCDTLRDFAQEYLNLQIPDPEHYGEQR